MPPTEPQVHITWRQEPPTPAQRAAWRQLWARLLEPIERGPETRQPQDLSNPGAATVATISSGHNFNEDIIHDSTITLHPK